MAGGIRRTKSAAPSTPAANKQEDWYDSTSFRTRVIDEKGLKVDVSGGLDTIKSIINGGFKFAQRQAPATLTSYALTTNRTYAADRWGMTIQTSSLQYARVDTLTTPETGLASRYYGQFKQVTGAGKFIVSHVIEGNRAAHLRNRQVRLMAVMKASSAKTIRFGLLQLNSSGTVDTIPAAFESAFGADTVDPTWGTNLALITPDLLPVACFGVAPGTQAIRSTALDCSVTTAWQTFGSVFTVPSNYKNLIPVFWTDAQFAVNDILNVSQVTLLNQAQDCDWNDMPDEQELEACQRYYCKSFNVDTNPAQNAGGTTGEVRAWSPVGASLPFTVAWTWEFPVPMRVAPTTITLYNPSAATAQVRNATLGTDCTVSTATASGEKRLYISGTTPASTAVGNILSVHVSAAAEL